MPKVEEDVKDVAGREDHNRWRLSRTGVNLGGLYGPTRAIEKTPVFTQQPLPERFISENVDPLHVAVVKIRSPQSLDDETLSGVGLTLSQLTRLGLNSAVVVDCDDEDTPEVPDTFTGSWRDGVIQHAERLVSAIEKHNAAGARIVDQALGVSNLQQEVPSTVHVRGGVDVWHKELLMSPLRRGMAPVLLPIAHSRDTLRAVRVQSDDVVLALTRELAGLTSRTTEEKQPEGTPESVSKSVASLREMTSLDRIIVLDPLGGIPARDRADKAHVFINLEQEYRDIRNELSQASSSDGQGPPIAEPGQKDNTVFGTSNPFSKVVEDGAASLSDATTGQPAPSETLTLSKMRRHTKNLDLVQRTLALLPPSTSALITTPQEAASSARTPLSNPDAPGVATRQQKNPLIYNLLTDKPIISSSLPMARFAEDLPSPSTSSTGGARLAPATFIKRGMPLTIIPDPRHHPWTPPGPEGTPLSLDDPRIDFPRLLHLIEDSFNRPLDVQHYLSRIRNRLAGIIIAGEYEGGAILTWEDASPASFCSPPSAPTSATSEARPPIPYLDKFAVLQRSQGAGGVADVVFNAMVRSCFPAGVVWRSRQNNPVNKWYFERAAGTWKIPGTQWTMFWTGPRGIEADEVRWAEMVTVCKGIGASWADQKPAD